MKVAILKRAGNQATKTPRSPQEASTHQAHTHFEPIGGRPSLLEENEASIESSNLIRNPIYWYAHRVCIPAPLLFNGIFQCEYKTSTYLSPCRTSGLSYNLSSVLDVNEYAKCPLSGQQVLLRARNAIRLQLLKRKDVKLQKGTWHTWPQQNSQCQI